MVKMWLAYGEADSVTLVVILVCYWRIQRSMSVRTVKKGDQLQHRQLGIGKSTLTNPSISVSKSGVL